MDVGFEALTDHADGVANSVLCIDHEFVRQNVEDLAVFGERDVAGGIDGSAHIVSFDVARAVSQRDAAAAVDAANMAASHAYHGGFDRDIGHAFGFFHGAANRAYGGIQIDDEAFAQTLGFRSTQCKEFNLFAVDFRDQCARFRTADVQPYYVTIFF